MKNRASREAAGCASRELGRSNELESLEKRRRSISVGVSREEVMPKVFPECVRSLLLVRPGAPSGVLAPSSDARSH